MSEWKECKIADISSSNLQSITKDYPYKTILYLDTSSITCGKLESYQEFTINDAPSRAKRIVSENDIVYSTVRPIQRHYGMIKNPLKNLIVSTGFSVISVNEAKADAKFVYYYLTSNEIVEYLDSVAEGSTSAYPSLKPSDIDNLSIFLPPLPDQKAIASVLSSLDDKIDLLHRQNKTLETMAEALFRQWFVEEAEDSWQKCKIGDLFTLQRGYDLPVQNRTDGIYPIVTSSGINGSHCEYKVKGPGVVTGRSGLIGKVFYVSDDFWPLNTTLYIKSYNLVTPLYSYFFLKTLDLGSYNAGSSVPTLNRNHVHDQEAVVPPKTLVLEFEKVVKSNFDKIDKNTVQIHTLTKLRDTLLPKLMSGEVRVNV